MFFFKKTQRFENKIILFFNLIGFCLFVLFNNTNLYRESDDNFDVFRFLTNNGNDQCFQDMFHGVELCLSGKRRVSPFASTDTHTDTASSNDTSVDSTIDENHRAFLAVNRTHIIAATLRLLTCIAEQCLNAPLKRPHWFERYMMEVCFCFLKFG